MTARSGPTEAAARRRWAARLPAACAAALHVIAGVLLFAMMILTVVDVIGRYLFTAPVPGAFEATEVMLVLIVFVGMPIVTGRQEHVSVLLFYDRAPAALVPVLRILSRVLTAVALGVAAWLLYEKGVELAAYGDTTVLLRIPLAPVAYAMAALSAVATVVAAIAVFHRGEAEA
ncbi:TRAP transporter small permease [Amorphus orientalis]|uniref:TRAP transporter small permease protein n=1 Tax=Amorphus orientalis TaxID=649198 RepID=A0AAE3VL76_9HYPH|nr:TRAP transporter small permease [Amorphus orientalis]MDQ0314209.1 TRAP-type C4-dicarboxylate transport system permease small subunit [Amorphus orientalis]